MLFRATAVAAAAAAGLQANRAAVRTHEDAERRRPANGVAVWHTCRGDLSPEAYMWHCRREACSTSRTVAPVGWLMCFRWNWKLVPSCVRIGHAAAMVVLERRWWTCTVQGPQVLPVLGVKL